MEPDAPPATQSLPPGTLRADEILPVTLMAGEWSQVIAGIAELPHKIADPLLQRIKGQLIQAHMAALEPPPAAEATAAAHPAPPAMAQVAPAKNGDGRRARHG